MERYGSRRCKTGKNALDAGADIDARNKKGETPLHVAIIGRNKAIVQLLLDRGADKDARDKSGLTPYLLATKKE
jgi:FOG: Ankyrin repeat